MRLRTQLLLVSLLTLALPWAGCQYVREFETALRQNQQDSLADGAGAIAALLEERPRLLVRDPLQLVSPAEPGNDIYASRLPAFITLDGFIGDWTIPEQDFRAIPGTPGLRFAAGLDDSDLWLYVEVQDDDVRYESPDSSLGDHVLIDYEDSTGTPQRLLVATGARGRSGVRRRDGTQWINEPRAQAVWEENSGGYQIEIRLRKILIGPRLGLSVVDADSDSDTTGYNSTFSDGRPGLLWHRLAPLEDAISDFRFGNRRIIITNPAGWVIASAGDLQIDDTPRPYPLAERLLRNVIRPGLEAGPLRVAGQKRLTSIEVASALQGQTDARWYSSPDERSAIVVATHPIDTGGQLRGAVVLEQTSEAILSLTDRALTRLVTLTLLATLVAAMGLLGFATYLSIRIKRLSNAAAVAVSPEGDISDNFPGTQASDELGDLSRNFASLLGRLREHTDYLRTLAGKLSHELRTPLAVVQSSLDNLDAAGLPEDAQVYAGRAREGSQRLRSILTAMSEASRVEQSITQAEVERFDLRELVEGCFKGYRDIHQARRFTLSLPDRACPVDGVPELIAQMLDKLVDNAADFSPENGHIDMRLAITNGRCMLEVANEGPTLPAKMQSQIFDSMVSVRERKGNAPHLGFGLHIAKLIAESHKGTISCSNLPDDKGAVFRITLPLATST